MQICYRIAADCVVLFHLLYALVVVLGLPVTWIGILRRAQWARNFWWRCGHLAMIMIVVVEAMAGIACPLTTWETQLRKLAQQKTYRGAFLANLVHDWLFYEAQPWVFTLVYSAFGLVVLTSFIVAPPRWPSFQKTITTTS